MSTISVLCDRVGDAGGAERYWETLVPALVARGITVRVMARDVADRGRLGIDTVPVAWGSENQPSSPDAARFVADELERTRPDVVVTASVFDHDVLDAVRAAPARWLARVHDHRPFCPNGDRVYPQFSGPCSEPMGDACRRSTLIHGCVHGPRPASFRAITAREQVRDCLARADRVLVSSDHMRMTCLTNGIADGRIAITPPPLADDAFAAAPIARPAQDTLLFAGRLTPRKGLRSLIAAVARIAPAARPHIVVAGTGDTEQAHAADDAARAGVAITWLGQLSPAQLRGAIDAATAVAIPSMWPEPFGLIGIEAQARGRPAVAYQVGGIAEWIGDAGIAVPRGDEAALAAAIQKVFDQREWPAYSAAAWQRAQSYRLAAHVDRFLELCDAAEAVVELQNGAQHNLCG